MGRAAERRLFKEPGGDVVVPPERRLLAQVSCGKHKTSTGIHNTRVCLCILRRMEWNNIVGKQFAKSLNGFCLIGRVGSVGEDLELDIKTFLCK